VIRCVSRSLAASSRPARRHDVGVLEQLFLRQAAARQALASLRDPLLRRRHVAGCGIRQHCMQIGKMNPGTRKGLPGVFGDFAPVFADRRRLGVDLAAPQKGGRLAIDYRVPGLT
jgi:hypothetical protein